VEDFRFNSSLIGLVNQDWGAYQSVFCRATAFHHLDRQISAQKIHFNHQEVFARFSHEKKTPLYVLQSLILQQLVLLLFLELKLLILNYFNYSDFE
jgi:hypothetical protein